MHVKLESEAISSGSHSNVFAPHTIDECAERAYEVSFCPFLINSALDLVFLPNAEIMSNDTGDQLVEIGASVLADLQNDFVHSVRQEICRDQNLPTSVSDFRLLISKSHSRAVIFGVENQSYLLEIIAVLFSQLGIYLNNNRNTL